MQLCAPSDRKGPIRTKFPELWISCLREFNMGNDAILPRTAFNGMTGGGGTCI